MRRVIEPLTQMGARFEAENNCLPMKIHGVNPLEPISYKMPIASAQVKSCVLLAGLNAAGKTKVLSPEASIKSPTSRNHTELMLRFLGADLVENYIETENGFIEEITIDGRSELTARNLNVPSDISSAAFFLVAASCLKDSEIVLENVGVNPSRTAIIEVLRGLGAEIETLNLREISGETVGDLLVRRRENFTSKAVSNIISGEIIGNLIDEIPILAIFGTQIAGGLEIRNAEELRVKESDRIKSVVENLRRMNAKVEEFPDGFRIEKSELKAATIDSFGDHRIAMAFSIGALFVKEGETEIVGAECASVSFPEFYETLASITKR
jgi:3-phosphoshikimate 1-carboxyvinyltransferase